MLIGHYFIPLLYRQPERHSTDRDIHNLQVWDGWVESEEEREWERSGRVAGDAAVGRDGSSESVSVVAPNVEVDWVRAGKALTVVVDECWTEAEGNVAGSDNGFTYDERKFRSAWEVFTNIHNQ